MSRRYTFEITVSQVVEHEVPNYLVDAIRDLYGVGSKVAAIKLLRAYSASLSGGYLSLLEAKNLCESIAQEILYHG